MALRGDCIVIHCQHFSSPQNNALQHTQCSVTTQYRPSAYTISHQHTLSPISQHYRPSAHIITHQHTQAAYAPGCNTAAEGNDHTHTHTHTHTHLHTRTHTRTHTHTQLRRHHDPSAPKTALRDIRYTESPTGWCFLKQGLNLKCLQKYTRDPYKGTIKNVPLS